MFTVSIWCINDKAWAKNLGNIGNVSPMESEMGFGGRVSPAN